MDTPWPMRRDPGRSVRSASAVGSWRIAHGSVQAVAVCGVTGVRPRTAAARTGVPGGRTAYPYPTRETARTTTGDRRPAGPGRARAGRE